MKKIVYVNHRQLKNTGIHNLLRNYNHDWDQFVKFSDFSGGVDSHYFRLGKNSLPFKNELIHTINKVNPVYDCTFNMSLSNVTDYRCFQLRQTHWDKPWLVMWSGGIDSTVIVASILKNLSPADRANITICCNRISVYEYPEFYYKHILPNFQILDSSNISIDADLLDKYYIFDGDPGDQLFVAGGHSKLLYTDPDLLHQDIRSNSTTLIKLLETMVDHEFAVWFYEVMMENINSVDIPVENIYDFFWWYSFNPQWTAINIRALASQTSSHPYTASAYFKNFIHWFDSLEYQHWSITNKIDTKWDGKINGHKLPYKQYIYDYNQDAYYYQYKIKTQSTGHTTSQYIAPWFCILDDYTRLYLDRDYDEIINLLPEHIS